MFGNIKVQKDMITASHSTESSKDRKADEISACSRMINQRLSKDSDPLVKDRLPVKPASEDVFYQMADGLFFIKLLNLIDPDAVDMRTINQYKKHMNKYEIVGNINQAITSAKGLIKMVGVMDTAFTNMNQNVILGLLTQCARLLSI